MRTEQSDVFFQGQVTFANIPTINTDKLINSVTPSVNSREVFKCSGAVVTITNFTNSIDGQRIYILGDGNTTIANNSNIKTNTGANKLLAANKVYRFTYFKSLMLWVEDA